MRKFKVVGPCRVAGVAPGDTVTEDTLNEWNANIEALIGVHLEPVGDKTSTRTTKKGDDK